MNVTKLWRPPARSGAVLYPGRGLRSFLRMQSVQRGACPRRHPELGRKRAGLLIQENGAGCIVFLQKQCAGQIIARLRPEVAVGSKPQLGAEIGGVAARLAPLHGHHVLQVQHSLAEMPEQRVARRQRAHFVTQICELAAGRGESSRPMAMLAWRV